MARESFGQKRLPQTKKKKQPKKNQNRHEQVDAKQPKEHMHLRSKLKTRKLQEAGRGLRPKNRASASSFFVLPVIVCFFCFFSFCSFFVVVSSSSSLLLLLFFIPFFVVVWRVAFFVVARGSHQESHILRGMQKAILDTGPHCGCVFRLQLVGR